MIMPRKPRATDFDSEEEYLKAMHDYEMAYDIYEAIERDRMLEAEFESRFEDLEDESRVS